MSVCIRDYKCGGITYCLKFIVDLLKSCNRQFDTLQEFAKQIRKTFRVFQFARILVKRKLVFSTPEHLEMPQRCSRHYYNLYRMSQTLIKDMLYGDIPDFHTIMDAVRKPEMEINSL